MRMKTNDAANKLLQIYHLRFQEMKVDDALHGTYVDSSSLRLCLHPLTHLIFSHKKFHMSIVKY